MKKRIFSVLMFLLMTIALVACNTSTSVGDTGNQTDNTQIIDPESDPLAFLEAAGEKLKNADSFETKVLHWSGVRTNTPYTPDQETEQLQMWYVANLDGSPASYLKAINPYSDWYYFHGNFGYSGNLDDEEFCYETKHIRDEGFSPEQHFWFIQNGLNFQNDAMFESFCQLEHTIEVTQDGKATILFDGLSGDQLISLMDTKYPMLSEPLDPMLSSYIFGSVINSKNATDATCKFTMEFTVDNQGFLSGIKVVLYWKRDGASEYVILATRSLIFTNINKEMSLQRTDFEANFKSKEKHPDIYHHFGEHYSAQYIYHTLDSHQEGYLLSNFCYMCLYGYGYYQIYPVYQYSLETDYKVPSQLVDIPVNRVSNTGYDIEKIIIPAGVRVDPYGEDGATGSSYGELFFEDSQKNVDALHRSYHPNYYFTSPVYYAGEWEYVDGVPTPIE